MTPPPVPFVVGSGRSGTTLMRFLLDAHPDLAIPDESNVVPALLGRASRYGRNGSFEIDRFVDDVFATREIPRWGVERAAVADAIRGAGPGGVTDAIRALYVAYARSRGKPRWGDKTPRYVLDATMLAEAFPEARFVNVIRDGRDVALSFLDAPFGPRSVGDAAVAWRERIHAASSAAAALGPERFRSIRYEALVDDPESVARELCAFLDLDFDPAMLRYHERDEARRAAAAPKYRRVAEPPTKGVRDWRRDMAPADVEMFEAIAGATLSQLGYEVVTARARTAVRVRAAAVRMTARARRDARRHVRSVRSSFDAQSGRTS